MISQELLNYAIDIRREIHRHPETGFDLPVTAALVKRELDKMGIPHRDDFCRNGVVAYLGTDPEKRTIALRADMDALPVTEKTGLPYSSEVPGKMHACGHDSHTAILLAVAKTLKAEEAGLPVNLRFFFQPSEECEVSGAKAMVDNGCMDGVDLVVGIHCEPELLAGEVGVKSGEYMAACMVVSIVFHGRTCHATKPAGGIDAIRMAHLAYDRMEAIVREEAAGRPYIWSVGRFSGGSAHNVIADRVELAISFRFYDEDFALRAITRVENACAEIASSFGGSFEIKHPISTHALINDPEAVSDFRAAFEKELGFKPVDLPGRMSSEDFSWYLQKAPGFIFRFGTGNGSDCSVNAHRNDFKIDESGIRYGIESFLAFVRNTH